MPDSSTDSRSRILEAARHEFGERGFAGARTQRIAERASVNKQLLFYYFGSKQGLYEAVLQEAGANLVSAVRPDGASPPGPGGVRKQLAAAFEGALSRPDVAQIVVRGALSGEAAAPAREAVDRLVGEIRAAINAGQGIGYFRDDAEPERVARQAAVLVLGYIAFERVLGAPGTAADRQAWLDGVVDLLIAGLTW